MAVDRQRCPFGCSILDHIPPSYIHPDITTPWALTSDLATAHSIYAPSQNVLQNFILDLPPQSSRINNLSMPSYTSLPMMANADSPLLKDVFGRDESLTLSQELSRIQNLAAKYRNEISLLSCTTMPLSTYPPFNFQTEYDCIIYAPAPNCSTHMLQNRSPQSVPLDFYHITDVQQQLPLSPIDISNRAVSYKSTCSFGDTIHASRSMMPTTQDTAPNNIHDPGTRTGTYPGNLGGFNHQSTGFFLSTAKSSTNSSNTIDSSVSDYSHAIASLEMEVSELLRTLQGQPASLPGSVPDFLLGQYNSKTFLTTQKKCICKVCNKRFRRPSSLQTHMYSHTGEKPFSCGIKGCGRHFSVISNLYRHRKIHMGGPRSKASSKHHSHD